jgi:hypothetical protein
MSGTYLLTNVGYGPRGRRLRPTRPEYRRKRLQYGTRRIPSARTIRMTPEYAEHFFDKMVKDVACGMLEVHYQSGTHREKVDFSGSIDNLPHKAGLTETKPPKVEETPEPAVEETPEPEVVPDGCQEVPSWAPSEDDLDGALKAQLVEWADTAGLGIEEGSKKAEYLGALKSYYGYTE